MKKQIIGLLLFLLVKTTFGQKNLDGIYIGLQAMCWTDSAGKKDCYKDPTKPQYKWYHATKIKIKGDTVFVDQNPICIYKKDTLYSASDGAFFYYIGSITQQADSSISLHLTELYCDYCGEILEKQQDGTYKKVLHTREWKGKLSAGRLFINSMLFRKIEVASPLLSERYFRTNQP